MDNETDGSYILTSLTMLTNSFPQFRHWSYWYNSAWVC